MQIKSLKIPSFIYRITILVASALLCVNGVWGQSTGDYRSNATTMNWDARTSWQRYNGSSWETPSTGQGYPGQNTGTGTVTILNTHNVTLNVSPANNIGALVLQTGNRASSITFNGTNSLNVTGSTTIEVPTSTDASRYKYIRVLAGSFSTASIVMEASSDNGRDSYIEISSGSVNVSGDITMNATDGRRNYILFTGNGTLNVGGTITGGIITSTTGGSQTAAPTSGTVNYNRTGNQNIGTYTYFNLSLSESGNKSIATGTQINNVLAIAGTAKANIGAGLDISAGDLSLGGDLQRGGTWGSSSSPAVNQNDTYFTASTGYITVSPKTFYSRATGNWNTNTTWSYSSGGDAVGAGIYPVDGDIVNIQGNFTITVTSHAACASITFPAANPGLSTVTISGTNSLTVSGAITMGRPGNNGNNPYTINVGQGSLSCGSIALGGTTGNRTTIINISTGTLTVTGNITSSGVASQLNFTGAGTLNAGGTFMSGTAGTFTASTGTVNFNATGAQTIASFAYTFNNVTLSGSGAKTLSNATINGVLSLEGTATTAGSAPTYGTNATLQYNRPTALTASNVEWITPFTATGGVVIANTGTITMNAAKVFGNNTNVPLTINNGATLTTGNYALTFHGDFVNTGTLAAGSSPVTITGTTAAQNIGAFTTTGLVSMTKTGGTATFTGDVNGAGLTINGSGGTLNLGNGLTHTFTGTWTRTNGTLNGGSSNLVLRGAVSGTGGTFTANSGTVEWNASGAQTIANLTYNNLALSGSGTKTLQANTTVSSLRIDGTSTLDARQYNITGNASGTMVMAAGTGLIIGNPASTTANAFPSNFTAANITLDQTSTVTYSANADQAVSGVPAYGNLTISGGNTKTINNNTRVNGILNLNSGILALGSNDLTLGPGAGTTGTFSASNMINIGNRSVIKEGNVNSDFIITLPVGIGTAYTPVNIADFSATAIAPASRITIQSAAAPAPGVTGAHPLNRHWVTSASGISGSVLADISFTYLPSDIPAGGTAGMYEIVYKPASGDWGMPGGASAAGSNPLRATAATTLNATWTGAEPEKHIFYSFKSGSWDDASTWTLDPSGTQWLNPNSYTPTTSPTSAYDEVIILSGRVVTIPTGNKTNKNLTVTGTLDFGTTTGHSFVTISGTGRIRLAGDNFPAGDATDFITEGHGEGTVEYYGTTRNLTAARTLYNAEVNMTAGNTLTLLTNYTINGNLTVSNGIFSINNNSSAITLNITVYGNVTIESSGRIATGTANARHQLNLYGDFTNNGEARFTNRTASDYTNEATNGIVDVNFLNASKNQSIMCRGITNFYRIEIDKGADFTYVLNIDATSTDNFNLFGYANEGHGSIRQLTANNNALGLVRGTVRIGNSIEIPSLTQVTNYNVSENAQLWIDRGTVRKNAGTAIAVYGKIRITNGLLEARINSGITFRENGILSVEGGTLNANQIRTTVEGTSTYGGYVQTGGEVNVLGGSISADYYVFSLPYPSSVFNMSGGTLKVNTSAANGAILINSAPENIKVTGGTVIAETQQPTRDFQITSTAPFWNFELRNTTSVARVFSLTAANGIGPSGNKIDVPAQPLRVLNDFRIWGKESGGSTYPAITFDPGTNDVYIGGSFFIENGARYIPISGGTPPYDAIGSQPTLRNTTYFIKTAATGMVEELYQGDASNPLEFGNLVIDRTNGYEVRLTSAAGRINESVVLDVNGNASVLSGTLNQNLFTIRTWGAIVNNDRMGTWYPGTTPSRAQIQLVENPALTLSTGSNAVFGNVQVNVTPPSVLTLTSDVYIERMEYVKGLIYLKNYNLKVDNLWNLETGIFQNVPTTSYLKVLNNGRSGSSMIYTDGKASDGGLTLRIAANSQAENENNILNNFGPVTFPLGFTNGTNLYFRPAQMVVKNYSSPGYITIRPVMGALPTTNQAGGQVLQHYWRVSHSGFTALPTVSYRFYYRNQTGVPNVDLSITTNEDNYVPGKVLDETPYTRGSENTNDIFRGLIETNSRAITINGTSTGGLFSPSAAGVTLENANYTAGVPNRFTGSVLIYYTRDYAQEATWTTPQTWTRSDILNTSYAPHDSRQPAASTYPGAGDVAVIGWIPWNDAGRTAAQRGQPHGVWISGYSQQVAEVVFTKMTDASGNPVPRNYRSNFQFRPTLCIDQAAGQLVTKLVKGEGLFWNRASDPNYNQMDIGDFARQDSSYVIYENFANGRIIYNTPELLPNLYISNDNWGAADRDFTFANNITTTGNVELLGNVNLLLPTGATGDITVGRNLIMFVSQNSGSGAEIGYGNTGTARKIVVKGDLVMANANSIINVRNPNTTAPLVDHELHIHGNIIQGTAAYASTGLDLWSGANNDRITLYLQGNSSMTYTRANGTIPDLYRVVVNKGTSQDATARFNTDFVLNGPTNGAGTPKALELQNGTFIYNNPNAARILNLTTGNDYFSIPSTAGLEIIQGTVRASGTSGISLDGKLTISGGTLDMSGNDNPVEYSASGNATIHITNGTLTVGGQIRRSPTSDIGILNYSQSGGTVIVGNNAATVNNRGVFEILNPGSSFTMTGGDLYIARSQTNPTISSFYFDPASYNIGASANIYIGHSTTPASQTIGIYAGKPLPRLRINGSSTLTPKVTARLEIVPAVITSLLQIDAGTAFNANGLDLTLNGDMTASGTFIPGGNTTFFSGSGTQTINGGGTSVNFYNLDKTSSGNLALNTGNTPLLISNTFRLRAGIFTDNGNTITTKSNVLNDATHVNNGTGDGIVMNGDIAQVLTGNGTFGKLTINNPNGVSIPVGNQLTITQSLKMQAGVLNIGRNLLDLGVNAVIDQASPFSATNMIETNTSFTDNGLRKTFRSGSSPEFIFPMGSNDKYTPVRLTISANGNNTGSITVKPANEMHPGIIDTDNALQYYWTLKAEGITGFSANVRMKYSDTDVKVNPPNTVADYLTASLLAEGGGSWLKFTPPDFDETNKELIFNFTSQSDAGISGDYTAGVNSSIPGSITSYQTNSSGNWTTAAIWTPNVNDGPRGAIAKINDLHTVDVTANYLSGYMTEVNGTLKLYSTFGHRLGIVSGTGTIYLERGDMPAAVYDKFFSSTGGTVEFGGITGYEILGNITEVNHLKLSGTGEKRLPNNNPTLNGNLIISGSADLNVINYYNRKVSIKGDLIRTTGSFEAGSGANATLAFTGTLPQTITGAFSNNNALNNLEINNINDVTISDDVEIDRELKLVNGLVNVASGSLFRINYGAVISPASGSPLSFVNGTMTKEMMNGNSFTFPTGHHTTVKAHGPIALNSVTGPAGLHDWTATYYFTSPSLAGYNTSNVGNPVSTVSNTEYWRIEAPAGGASVMSITLDGSSDIAASVPDLANLRIVGWNSTENQWEVAGTGATVTGSAASGVITTVSPVDYDIYSYFTLASVTPVAIGSATIATPTPASMNLCTGSSATITVSFTGEMPYLLTYTAGAATITTPAINASSYNITVTPSATTVYTLTGVTANGVPGFLTGTTSVTVNVSPIPTVNLSRSGSGSICEGSSITFTATAGHSNYEFRVNGITVQNGAGNTYVTTTLPSGTQDVDVIGTNVGGCSATSSAISVTVNPKPDAAGAISGPASVCRGSNGVYTISTISNATSYVWTATNGATVSSSGSTSKTITFPNAGTSVITVYGVNTCGNGASSTFNVAVNTASTPGAAGSISGPSQVCRGGTGYVYTVNPVANATSYIWTYSGTGATITGTGNSVTIDFAAGATSGNLRVAGTNGCATGTYSSNFSITTNASPSASITPAAASTCSGVNLALTATPSGGNSPYTHSWTGTGAGHLSSVSSSGPLFNSPDGGFFDLTYTVTDNRGCTGTAYATVTVFQAPVAYAGPDLHDLCSGTSQIVMTGATASGSYSGMPVWSGTGGNWTQNPDPALAAFTPSSPSGSITATLTLTGANGCVNVIDTLEISWNSSPSISGAFTTFSASVCRGQTGVVYSVPADPRAITYFWSYSGTGAIINGTGNSITVDFSPTATTGNLTVSSSNACGTSAPRTIAVTVIAPPVATFIYPSTPYCPTASNPLPQFTGGGVAGSFSSTSGLVFVSTVTGQVNLAASTPGDYTVTNTIAAAGGCGIVTATSPISIISDFTWTGTTGPDWNNPANWSCNQIPGASNSITILDVANKPVLSSGTVANVRNLTIGSGASLTVTGNTIRISGTIINNGTFNAAGGTVELNGTAAQQIGANLFENNLLGGLTVNNNSGVSLMGPLNVSGVVLIQSGAFASNGYLTLASTTAGTALIDGSGSGNVTGNVTMQRYLPSGFGYKYFSSPFQAATVAEFGNDMDLSSAFTPFYRYDENRWLNDTVPASGWVRYNTPATNVLAPMAGYSVNFGSDAAEKTVDVTGVVNNGNLSVTLHNHNHVYTKGFNLVGNPYPSPIDWNAYGWTKTNIDDAIYFFKASDTDQYGGEYTAYVNGVSDGKGATNIIASMQGFFVHVSNGAFPVTGTLAVSNLVRTGNVSAPFFKKGKKGDNDERSLINLSAAFSSDESRYDPIVVYFDEKGTNNFDSQADALKLFNTDNAVPNFYSFGDDGSQLAINALFESEEKMQPLPLGLITRKDGEVVFRLREMTGIFSGSDIYLFDSGTGQSSKLNPGMEYRTYLSTGTHNSRFFLNFENIITGTRPDNFNTKPVIIYSSGNTVFVKVNCLTGKPGILTIYNLTGQAVFNTTIYDNGHHEFNPQVMDGIYIASFVSGNIRFTQKVFIRAR